MIDECIVAELDKLRVLMKMFEIDGDVRSGDCHPDYPFDHWYEFVRWEDHQLLSYMFDHPLEMILFVNDFVTNIQKDRAAS